VDLRLEHDVHHYLGHSRQRTRSQHLTRRQERRVLSQRNTMTDDRPRISQRAGCRSLSRQGVARGRQSCRASCLPDPSRSDLVTSQLPPELIQLPDARGRRAHGAPRLSALS
jgi:hypothetical protein